MRAMILMLKRSLTARRYILDPARFDSLIHFQLAETLTAKTNPKAGKTRSKDTSKPARKGKGKAATKPAARKPPQKKKKTQRTESPIDIVCVHITLASSSFTDFYRMLPKPTRTPLMHPRRLGGKLRPKYVI